MAEEPVVTPTGSDEIKQLVAEIKDLVKGGDASALQARLVDFAADNAKLRSIRRQLQKQVEELKGHGAVPEGGLILTADEAKTWAAYVQLGAPAEVKKQLDSGAAAITATEQAQAEAVLDQAATVLGFRPTLFKALVKAGELTVTVEDGTEKDEEGKPLPVVQVVPQGGAKQPLADYAQAHWSDDLPALMADQDTERPLRPARPAGSPVLSAGLPRPGPGRSAKQELIAAQAALLGYSPY